MKYLEVKNWLILLVCSLHSPFLWSKMLWPSIQWFNPQNLILRGLESSAIKGPLDLHSLSYLSYKGVLMAAYHIEGKISFWTNPVVSSMCFKLVFPHEGWPWIILLPPSCEMFPGTVFVVCKVLLPPYIYCPWGFSNILVGSSFIFFLCAPCAHCLIQDSFLCTLTPAWNSSSGQRAIWSPTWVWQEGIVHSYPCV